MWGGSHNQISPSIVGGFDVSFEELIEMMTDGRISKEEFGWLMAGAKQDYHDDINRAGGLSYTAFGYSDLEITEKTDALEVSVMVANIGAVSGSEVVQLYMQDVCASLVRPVKELKGFKKIWLEPGEKQQVTVSLEKAQMGFYDDDMNYHLEDGRFVLYIGGNSRDVLEKEVEVRF